MKWLAWNRTARIAEIRNNIWRVISPAATAEETLLHAAALLQMQRSEVVKLGTLHFLLSHEAGALVDDLPRLLRRLSTTTEVLEEHHPERLRGSILWGKTLSTRATSGSPFAFVTAPARRAHQTPENELLVHVLDAYLENARRVPWVTEASSAKPETIREIIAARRSTIERYGQARSLQQVERVRPTARSVHRVKTGRHARAYASTLATYERLQSLAARANPAMVRATVESHAIVTRDNPILFELVCLFRLRDALTEFGWNFGPAGLVHNGVSFKAVRGEQTLRLWYQAAPRGLRSLEGSKYARVQTDHHIRRSEVRPDAVIRHSTPARDRWLVVEMKMSFKPPLRYAARRAIFDLLAYREAFGATLESSPGPYGLGLLWGEGLVPQRSEMLLATPDHIVDALRLAELA